MKSFKGIITFISLLCIVLCFSGCGSAQTEEASDCKVNNQEQQNTAGDKTPEDSEQEITVEGHCYTVALPDEWQGRYTREDITDGGSIYDAFYQSASMSEEGGHLFSIALMPETEDYTVFPSYDWLGVLKTPDGEFNMIVIYPTDVQFSEDTAAEYNEMAADIDRIIKTVKAAGGAEFVKG